VTRRSLIFVIFPWQVLRLQNTTLPSPLLEPEGPAFHHFHLTESLVQQFTYLILPHGEKYMKAPICNVCLKSDVLCSNCGEKLENDEITELEIDISRRLKELSDDYGSLKDSEIIHAYDTENVIVIVTGEGDGAKVVGRNGEIVKNLAEEVDKSIRVVEKSEKDRKVIKGLISPAEIESINTVFSPEGQHKKIVIDEKYEEKINMTPGELEEVIREITETEYELSFE